MAGGAAVPPYPEFSSQEKGLYEKQGLTLDKINSLLDESLKGSTETQNILKSVSGLYDEHVVPEGNKPIFNETEAKRIRANIDRLKNSPGGLKQFRDKQIPGWVLDNLSVSGYDVGRTEDEHNQTKGGKRKDRVTPTAKFDALVESIKADPNRWRDYGLETSEAIPATTRLTPNREKIGDLRGRIEEYNKLQNEISLVEGAKYKAALEGNAPISEGTRQRKASDFSILKENLARGGNLIEGNDPATATANSTAGQQALAEFNKTWGLLEDQERHGSIAQGASTNLNRYSLTQGSTNPISLSTGASAYGPQSVIPGYMNLSGGYGNAAMPFAQQRAGQYQSAYGNAALDSQQQSAIYSLMGLAGGTLLSSGMNLGGGYLLQNKYNQQ
jgi:hypothetical protein